MRALWMETKSQFLFSFLPSQEEEGEEEFWKKLTSALHHQLRPFLFYTIAFWEWAATQAVDVAGDL